MTTVQIVGIAVAVAIVLLLVVALVLTRGRGRQAEPTAAATDSSFLDSAPRDTLATLGTAEHSVEDVTLDPGAERPREEAALEWPAESDTLGGSPDVPAPPVDPPHGDSRKDRGPVAAAEPACAHDAESDTGAEPAAPAGTGGRVMPLSDIIVTTSNKTVDLDDPEVRRMLADLVTLEIDQAAELRGQGQNIDAVLQLTEAEKISQALGMTESARRIRQMMEDLRGG
jgi:hypothetical protein